MFPNMTNLLTALLGEGKKWEFKLTGTYDANHADPPQFRLKRGSEGDLEWVTW